MIIVQVYEEDLAENISEYLSSALGASVSPTHSLDELSTVSQEELELIIYLNKYDLAGDSLTQFLNESGLNNVPVIMLVNDTTREDLTNSSHHLLKLPFELEDLLKMVTAIRLGHTMVR